MQKLLEKYVAAPTVENAAKVRAYENKHPMAACMLSSLQLEIMSRAIAHAKREG